MKTIRRGEIYYADLSPVKGSEQGGFRPVLIIQNNVGNHYSPTVIVAAITSRKKKHDLPTHVRLTSPEYGLENYSVILLEQVRTIDRTRLKDYVGKIDEGTTQAVDQAIAISMGIRDSTKEAG